MPWVRVPSGPKRMNWALLGSKRDSVLLCPLRLVVPVCSQSVVQTLIENFGRQVLQSSIYGDRDDVLPSPDLLGDPYRSYYVGACGGAGKNPLFFG